MCIVPPAFTSPVYKWVDEEGVVHFSDQPHPAAEKIELPPTPLYTAPPKTEPKETAPGEEATTWTGRYQQFAIDQPKQNETVRSNEGSVRVAVILQPSLQPGHQLRFYLDGLKVKGEFDTPGIILQGINRGPHTVKAEVLDEKGKLLGTTATVEFFLRKESEITPKVPPIDPDKPFKPDYPSLPQSGTTYPPVNSGTGKYPGEPQSDKVFPPDYQPKYDTKANP